MSFFIVLLLILFATEVLSFLAVLKLSKGNKRSTKRIGWTAYILWTLFIIVIIVVLLTSRDQFSDPKYMNTAFTLIGFWLMNFALKTILAAFFVFNQLVNVLIPIFSLKSKTSTKSRRQFITKTGLAIASIPFAGFFYGMVKGKYQFTVFQEDLVLKNIPDSFVGKTIVQISDLHLGSFPKTTDAIAKAVEKINALKADYIFFTGDMINERALEAEPWVDTMKNLTAKFGKYSVLGNHDYGDYYDPWDGKPDLIEANILRLKELQEQMGFTMLRNENIKLSQGEESIRLIGIENWGLGFTQAGDLKKALDGVEDEEVQILLSHDPSHWEEQVLGKTQIDVAMAGHTHGSQIGIETPVFRWSPIKFRYQRWAGLYKEGNQQLYVNRGLGYLGYGGRIGIWPEITLFTLKKES